MEWDPLVARGDQQLTQRRRVKQLYGSEVFASLKSSQQARRRLFTSISAALQSMLALVLCTYVMHRYTIQCGGVLAVLFTVDCFLWLMGDSKSRVQMGFRSLCGLMFGMVFGLWLYSNFMIYFYAHKDLRTYTNVLGSEVPEQFTDASILSFAHTTTIDVSRGAGFKSFAAGGKRYCAAPVIDTSLDTTQTVSVWAVGVDCCDSRSSFSCGDIFVSGAHAGVVLLRPEMFVHPALEGMMGDYIAERERFQQAVDLARHSFGVAVPDNHADSDLLVSWAYEPYKRQNQLKVIADWYVGWATLGICLFWAFVAIRGKSLNIFDSGEVDPQAGMQLPSREGTQNFMGSTA